VFSVDCLRYLSVLLSAARVLLLFGFDYRLFGLFVSPAGRSCCSETRHQTCKIHMF
jgi:hypothetical protein